MTGSLSDPQPPYSPETITLRLPNSDVLSYGLIVRDDEDNPSVISNVVSVPPASLMSATPLNPTVNSVKWLAIGLGVGLPISLIAIGVLVVAIITKMRIGETDVTGTSATAALSA